MLKNGDRGVVLQRDKQTYAVAPHIPCGVVTPELLRKLADAAERFGIEAMKISSAERILLVGLAEDQVDELWAELGMSPGAAVGLCVRSVRCCPGTTYCRFGLQDSLGLARSLDREYHGIELPGKMKMAVSGCPNQCAESIVRDIGLVGKKSGWGILLGGCVGARPRLGEAFADGLSDGEALALVARVIEAYRKTAKPKERLGRMIERLGGIEAFRGQVG